MIVYEYGLASLRTTLDEQLTKYNAICPRLSPDSSSARLIDPNKIATFGGLSLMA